MPLSTGTAACLLTLVAAPAWACPGLDPAAKPFLGEITFSQVYEMDTFSITGVAGGVFNLRDCGLEGEGLTGYRGDGLIVVPPNLVLHLQGETPQLVVSVENEDDTFLLIRDPQGQWLFNDNERGLNPMLLIGAPAPGDYTIWIGTHGTVRCTGPGRLMISETAA